MLRIQVSLSQSGKYILLALYFCLVISVKVLPYRSHKNQARHNGDVPSAPKSDAQLMDLGAVPFVSFDSARNSNNPITRPLFTAQLCDLFCRRRAASKSNLRCRVSRCDRRSKSQASERTDQQTGHRSANQ